MNYFQMGLRQKTNHKYSYRFSMNNFFQCLSVLYYCVLYEEQYFLYRPHEISGKFLYFIFR